MKTTKSGRISALKNFVNKWIQHSSSEMAEPQCRSREKHHGGRNQAIADLIMYGNPTQRYHETYTRPYQSWSWASQISLSGFSECSMISKFTGIAFIIILLKFTTLVTGVPVGFGGGCPNACSGHGYCTSPSTETCSCHEGWAGGDCSIRELCAFVATNVRYMLVEESGRSRSKSSIASIIRPLIAGSVCC